MKYWGFVLLLAMTVGLSACGEADIGKADTALPSSSDSKQANEKESPAPKDETYKVGEAVKFDDLIITVNGVRESEGEFVKPEEGKVIILVDVTAENKGTDEKPISSALQTKVADGDGYQYNLTIAEDGKGSFDGSVASGRKLRGEVAFEVPKDASSLEFIFSDPFKKGQAIWKIK